MPATFKPRSRTTGPVFQRRHYEAIVEAMRCKKALTIRDLADMFQHDNARFDRSRFERAIKSVRAEVVAHPQTRYASELLTSRCPDCGAHGERRGHQTCQYPTGG